MKVNKKKDTAMASFAKLFVIVSYLFVMFDLYGQGQTTSGLTVEQCLNLSNEKQQAGDIREATNYLNIAAEKCWDAKDYPKAIEYYNKSIELNKVISNWNGIAGINSNLGLIYFDMGEYNTSYDYLKKTYTYRKEHNEKVAVVSALINMSVALNKMERYDESVKVLEEAVNVSRDLNDYMQMRSCYGMLSETYTKAGNTEKAADYFYMYKTVHDALMTESEKRYKTELSEATYKAQLAETEKQLAETKKRYTDWELSEKEKELVGLDSANRELLQSKTKAELMVENLRVNEKVVELQNREIKTQLENERTKSRNLIFGLFATLLTILIIGFFLWQKKRDNRKLAQKNALINRQKIELEDAFAEIRQKNQDLITVNEQLGRTQKALDNYQEKLEQIVVTRTSQLRKALDQARESDRFKAAFFANMSHEIRTPLNAILGFSQLVDNPKTNTDRRREMFDIIKLNAEQLMRMVDDIVTLSEIDSGLVWVQPQKYDIDELLNEVMIDVEEMRKSTDKNKLEIIVDNRLPETVKSVSVDGKKIYRILVHLIENAIKYTDYGYIMFGCEADQQQKILRFWVEDTGIGIDAKHFESVFKRFWKQGDAYTQKYRGLGIGLSLCKELIDLMNGNISVESKTGHGSTFTFTVNYK